MMGEEKWEESNSTGRPKKFFFKKEKSINRWKEMHSFIRPRVPKKSLRVLGRPPRACGTEGGGGG